MKKLMTMIAAVAMSFGLYATEAFKAGTCFNDWTDISDRTDDENLTWSASLYDSTLINPAGWSFDPEDLPVRWAGESALNGLNIKTPLTSFVTCEATFSKETDEKIYVDTLVKFTAFDEEAQLGNSNAKLAVWIMETTNTTGEVAGTNLFVTAGEIAAGAVSPKIYDCGPYTAGEWCRLTIKSMGKITTSGNFYGFVVYLDGKPVKPLNETIGFDNRTLNTLAQYYADANILFPSIGESDITTLGFAGQGAIDDIAFTTLAPSFAQDMDYVTVNWSDVTSDIGEITLTTNDQAIAVSFADGKKIIYYTGDAPEVTFAWAGTETVLAGSKTLQSGDTLTIAEGDLQKAIVEFNGTKYATMSAAIDAAYTATGTDNTIKILADQVDGFTFSNNVANSSVTLDLNGKTVMGAEGYAAAIIVDSGALVITDSIGTGIVNGTACTGAEGTEPAAAVQPGDNDGTFTIQAGKFIGAVNGGTDLTGGVFDSDPSSASGIATGYKAVANTPSEGWWTIQPIVYVTAKFYVDSVLVDTQTIESGTEPTNVVVTKTGYTFTGWDPAIGAITADTDYNAVFALNVAEINGTPFTSLQEAFAVVGDNETIELINDIEATAQIDLERGTAANYTINLAGHTITNSASGSYVLWFKSQQTVKITDTVGNGKIERWTNSGTMIRVGYWGATTNYPAANAVALTLDGATVAGKIKDNAAFKVENGSFTMKSGSIDVDTSVSGVAISVRGANTAAINGGTLVRGAFEFGTGAESSQLTIDADVVATAETQFSVDPTAYLDDKNGYEGKQDETSGLWTVVEKQSEPVIDPTKPSDPMAEGAADALVAAINADKSKIGIPEDFTGMDDTAKETYQSYFDAVKVPVEGGDQFKVELQLNADGVEAVSNAVVTAETAILAANVATADATVSIENPIPGFYYGLRQGNSLTGDAMKITEVEKSLGTAIEFDAKHYENAGFYQMLVSPKELTVEVDPE